jgi:hypothetical protein
MAESQSKFNASMKSSTETARLSVPPRRAELFLERLANLDFSQGRKWLAFYRSFFDLIPTRQSELEPRRVQTEVTTLNPSAACEVVQPRLRDAWKEPDSLLKRSELIRVYAAYMKACDPSEGPARLAVYGTGEAGDKFLRVLAYALDHLHLLRYCANPDCKEPYFVASRASQTFCGSQCARPAQKAAKLRWWREHGAARRKKSRKG